MLRSFAGFACGFFFGLLLSCLLSVLGDSRRERALVDEYLAVQRAALDQSEQTGKQTARADILASRLAAFERAEAQMGEATREAIDRAEELDGLLKVANSRLQQADREPVPFFKFQLTDDAEKELAAPPSP